jgi:anti-sigma regulatory factor (Ser/Thr protein kinase)
MCDATETLRVGLALEEALWNAMFHGCLELTQEAPLGAARTSRDLIERRRREEPYAGRRICVDVRLTSEQATFMVRDDGPGFDTAKRPNLTDEKSWDQRGGRGVRLMQLFMDEVRFNDRGNEVTLIKKIHSFDFELNSPANNA